MNIELTTLSFDNYRQVLALEPSEEQNAYVEDWESILAVSYIGKIEGLEGMLWIITCDGEPVGRALTGKIETGPQEPQEVRNYGYAYRIMGFLVDRRWQSKGIGSQAFSLLLEKIYENPDGVTLPITLEVLEDNVTARRLYEKYGFYDSGIRYGQDCAYVKLP